MECNQLSRLTMQLKQIQNTEETMWAQSAYIKWLKEGGNNTIFFNHMTNCQRSKNRISLLEVDGVELSNQEAISNLVNFFEGLIGMTTPTF